jgi:GNAT superfamily N-acetyltransferase
MRNPCPILFVPPWRMLTATCTLAHRIERAEATLISSLGAAVARRLGESQVITVQIGGGAAVMPGPGSHLSKVSALGFERLNEAELDSIEARFARFQTPVRVELSSLGDPVGAGVLSARGYILSGFENVLARQLDQADVAQSAVPPAFISVTRTATDDSDRWVHLLKTAFAHADTFDGPGPVDAAAESDLDLVFRDFAGMEGFSSYIAFLGGEHAGAASMRVHDGVAQLCGAGTLPAHRRRGVQTALLQQRLQDAARAGCDIAVVTTEPASRSQANAQRHGFELLYVRAVLIKSV